ncbi:Uncharacterised protein [uncultured archaeon]|nr:Uncharacterised protein [uncultured archaeon]
MNESLDERLQRILPPGKYHNIRPLENNAGKKKAAFRADQGANGITRPVIVFLNSDESAEYQSRGYGISNEASILSGIGID